ncbi:hypothetical protein QCA50_002528 [Cerrena zonata]|uniref:Uncharacterized protein n=1 Tax=Cerrena zonata TaxID=2478898 RepID=A0AAW0GY56_9APHY
MRSLGVLYDIFPTYDTDPPISKAFAFRYADDALETVCDTTEGGDDFGMHRMSIHRYT